MFCPLWPPLFQGIRGRPSSNVLKLFISNFCGALEDPIMLLGYVGFIENDPLLFEAKNHHL